MLLASILLFPIDLLDFVTIKNNYTTLPHFSVATPNIYRLAGLLRSNIKHISLSVRYQEMTSTKASEIASYKTKPILTFVTGNKKKLEEVIAILGADNEDFPFEVKNAKLDLPELQGEPEYVASEKLKLAAAEIEGFVMVEDTSLCFNALGGLPGVYIKWFLEKLGHEGLNNILSAYEDKTAYAQCIFAFGSSTIAPRTFVGQTHGHVVTARGPTAFGWDPIFQPAQQGGNKRGLERGSETYAEMDKDEKNLISHRYRALSKLKAFVRENQRELFENIKF